MIPSYQQRGVPVSPAAFNSLVDVVRSSLLNSINGGTFQRSIGGTNINITAQATGSGSAQTDIQCPFKVSDASKVENEILVLKIEISQNPIVGTITEELPAGRYPQGMSSDPNAEPYKVTLIQEAGVEYVYVNLLVDQFDQILPGEEAITVGTEIELLSGNSTYQRFLVAMVEKEVDSENKPFISKITNACPLIFQRPAPTCPFLVEDDSRDGVCRITVRSGLVENTLPDGMTLGDTFSLVVSEDQNWYVVYCGMVVADGIIQTGPGNITIFTDTQYEANTDTYVYFKLAELTVGYRADSSRYVDWVLNTCAVPFVAGGGAVPCPYFKVTDASEGTVMRVEIAQNQIAGRWPDGMGLGYPAYKLDIAGDSYIYAKVLYDTTTLVIPTDASAITILASDALLPNTASEVYILIGTVLTAGDPLAITQITNVCTQPVPNPCNLAWTE